MKKPFYSLKTRKLNFLNWKKIVTIVVIFTLLFSLSSFFVPPLNTSFADEEIITLESIENLNQTLPVEEQSEILDKVSNTQAPFIKNEGQVNEKVKFYAQTFGGTLFVTDKGEMVYDFPSFAEATAGRPKFEEIEEDKEFFDEIDNEGIKHERSTRDGMKEKKQVGGVALKETFVGGKIKEVKAEGEGITKMNYFLGNDKSKWRSNVSTYEMVDLGEVYEGVKVKLRAYNNNVEKLFYVQSGVKADKVKMKVEGGKNLRVNDEGVLEVETEYGVVAFTKPVAYQVSEENPLAPFIKGEEDNNSSLSADKARLRGVEYVDVEYIVEEDEYSFVLGEYDKGRELVIDPLLASTFLGGGSSDYGLSLSLDQNENVYVTGGTYSSAFPTTSGAYDESFNGNRDTFVSKLSSNLNTLLASTFLGGSSSDSGISLALNQSGNLYITGWTDSLDFPTTYNAYDEISNGFRDVFVSKLSSDLSILLASTFIGGSSSDQGSSLTLDQSGNVYVTGETESSNFSTTSGAYNENYKGSYEVFVSKFSSDLSTLSNSTFLGGSGGDHGTFLILDQSENVYITGYTRSSDFPTTLGVYNQSFNGGENDIFISKLNNNLNTLLASTFIGGSSYDYGYSLSLDQSGNVYITGNTTSSNFPTTSGAYNENHNGGYSDTFVSKLSSNLSTLLTSTFIGGNSYDYGRYLTLDQSENVYISGFTRSSNFPTTSGAYDQSYNGGNYDVFVSKLSSDLSTLFTSTFLGGIGNYDYGYSLTLDQIENVYVTGITDSSNFPTTLGAYDQIFNGGNTDIFIAKLDSNLSSTPIPQPNITPTPSSYNFENIAENTTSSLQSFIIENTGTLNLDITTATITGTNSNEFLLLNNYCSNKTLAPTEKCLLGASFSPNSTGIKTANLEISSNDPDSPTLQIPLSGTGITPIINNVRWEDENGNELTGTYDEGTTVYLVADVIGPGIKQFFIADILEDDLFPAPNQDVTFGIPLTYYNGDKWRGIWETQWVEDISGDPEYFFTLRVYENSSGNINVSPMPEIAVSTTQLDIKAIQETSQESSLENFGPTLNAQPLNEIEVITMPYLDNKALIKTAQEKNIHGGPFQFAKSIKTSITTDKKGTWEDLSETEKLWRLKINSPKATSINLGFTEYNMPKGGKLFVYSPDYKKIIGPFTEKDNEKHGQLWTPIILGENIIIEVQIPKDKMSELKLNIGKVNHGFRELESSSQDSTNVVHTSETCNVDIACSEADEWRNQVRSVGKYIVNGTSVCSGSLINNTFKDRTPYFLTADHCGVDATNSSTVVVYWNFENSYCRPPNSTASGDNGDGSTDQFNTGAFFRADYINSDMTLLELDDPINPDFNVYYSGWDRTSEGSTSYSVAGIHHPNGAEKRISKENGIITLDGCYTSYSETECGGASSTPCLICGQPEETHIKIDNWNMGTIEKGSSGSPLFDSQGHIIGQSHGAIVGCGVTRSAWYGRFYTSWTGGGTDVTRLSNWLDPLDTGVNILEGLNASDDSFGIYNYGGANLQISSITKQDSSTWLTINPSLSYPITITPGEFINVDVDIDTAGLSEGNYSEHLVISSNDPDENPYPNGVDINLTVTACTPPTSGDWTISQSCTLTGTTTAPENVIVNDGAVLTIDATAILNIDFINNKLLVRNGGGVLIKQGGKIY